MKTNKRTKTTMDYAPIQTFKTVVAKTMQRIDSALMPILDRVIWFLGMKQRYFYTRSRALRLRFVLPIIVLFLSVATLTISPHHSVAFPSGLNVAQMVPSAEQLNALDPAAGHPNFDFEEKLNQEKYGVFSLASLTAFDIKKKTPPLERAVEVKPGDALGLIMQEQGVGGEETNKIIAAMKDDFDPRNIKAGQIIHMNFEKADTEEGANEYGQRFKEMQIKLNPIKTLVVARADDNFRARIEKEDVEKVVKAKQAEVKLSLYGSAAKAGIPKTVVANAIRIYSWNIDFQRDIRPNDKLEVMYESYETKSGHVADIGDILYAKLTIGGREIPLYRFKMKDGRVDYFKPDGVSIKRTLMKTPVDGARMSSGYGMRRHPVLGYNKMHKGVDFAAPTGTPIYAAGDGVVERAGRLGAYGHYIRIRHNSKLKTAYAHLSRYKKGIRAGSRVKQGEVIGYVGSTGRSTGPHLHYEVLVHGKQVNPRSVNLPIGEELLGKEKERFRGVVGKYRQQFVSLMEETQKVASRRNSSSVAAN